MKNKILLILSIVSAFACNRNKIMYDASGVFEATEINISAENSGKIMKFDIVEGQELKAGEVVGFIDSVQLYLKKKQFESQINAVISRKPVISVQLASLKEQLHYAQRELKRVEKLFKSDAATQKQVDDMKNQVEVVKKQIKAQESNLEITTEGIEKETSPLFYQIEQLNDQLKKCKIINPIDGVVITKYAENYEIINYGKMLYKVADIKNMVLKVYFTGDQLSNVKLDQTIKVFVDAKEGEYKEYSGKITFISEKAEFTPKTIQTKDERANLVYATKILVNNDGFLKIGMYGEVKF